MWKICLGGSFNPIHHGHLICARCAAEALGADGVLLIPNYLSPHKSRANPSSPDPAGPSHVAAAVADRLAMCRLAIADGGLESAGFSVDDLEILRSSPSYTIDTVRHLRNTGWPKVVWLIGSDALPALPTWHKPAELLAETEFAIMTRPGFQPDWPSLGPAYAKLQKQVVPVPAIDISATTIRSRVAAGLPIDYLTPPAVRDYIIQHNLYRTHSQSPPAMQK